MSDAEKKLEKALEQYDERTKERLAERIVSIAKEEPMSSTQRNCIRVLKVICPLALFFCAPVLTFIYMQLQKSIDPLVFWLSLIPLFFIAAISTIVNVFLKTPD